jgi:ankyrin repeat protein/serine/threonine protein kinase
LTEPDDAYFQIIEQLEGNSADIHALNTDGTGQTALHVAAAAGLDSIIELLVERGAHINAIDAAGDTPLHLAAKHGNLDAVKSLLNRPEGANAVINATNNENLTPLVQAVFESLDVEVVRELLHRGADPNVSILDDGTVLHLMTATPGFENVVREAIRCGGNLEARDNNGNTPLHVAAREGNTSLLELFLYQKADLANATNIRGQTPQQVAVENNHTEASAFLTEWGLHHAASTGNVNGLLGAISNGAARLSSPIDSASNTAVHLLAETNHSAELDSLFSDASRSEIDELLMCTNAQGNTALHVAAQNGSTEVVLSLTAQRSCSLQEAMKLRNADGLTPLLLAAKEGHVQVAHELLNEVPSGVMQGDEDSGNTALHFAAHEGRLPMVELLLARGADVNARNNFHQTPLHLAATWNQSLVVHRLLECGADPVAGDDQGRTPLELAKRQDHVDLCDAMLGSQLRRAAAIGDLLAVMSALTSGALVDDKNKTSGDTSLHVAAKNGHDSVLGTLLEHTPDPVGSVGVLNDAGDAPLHVAARAGETEIIRVILSVPDVDPNMTTAEGDTAVHIASGEGWIQVVHELFKGGADLNRCSEGRGCTALHDAACICDLAMVRTLLQLGANPNAEDSFSRNNPLHQVALWGQSDRSTAIKAELIRAGANQEARNCDGKTPADLERATAAANSISSVVEDAHDDLLGSHENQLEEEFVTRPPFMPSSAMMSDVPPAAAAIPTSSAWDFSSLTPPASAPTETRVPVPALPQPAADVAATTPGVAPQASPGRPTGPQPVHSEIYYPNIFATDEDPNSIPPEPPSPPRTEVPPPTAQVLNVPLQSVRAVHAHQAPTSPFAAALSPVSPQPRAINPAALNPLSAPPRSRTTSSQDDEKNNGVGNTSTGVYQATTHSQGVVERRMPPSSEASGATIPRNSSTSTSMLDNRLLIPCNQLKYDRRVSLGEGSYGKVFRGTLHGNRVAIKILGHQKEEYSRLPTASGVGAAGVAAAVDTFQSQQMMEDFVREIDVMAGLRHDNIQDLRGYCITPDGPAIVSKYYAQGSMADALRQGLSNPERRAELTWSRRLRMAVDVAAGLLYMHSYDTPILHRDLKAVNCFLDEHYRALVGDFGLTKPMQDRARSAASSGAGATNPIWLAPELITDSELGESHYTTKTDIYAFGMVMFELLTWKVPFRNASYWEIINKIGRGERPVIPARLPEGPDHEVFIRDGIMEEYVRLMNRCWAQDPAQRPEFEEIHPQLEKMLLRHGRNVRVSREDGLVIGGVGATIGAHRVTNTRINGGIGINGEPVRMALPQ